MHKMRKYNSLYFVLIVCISLQKCKCLENCDSVAMASCGPESSNCVNGTLSAEQIRNTISASNYKRNEIAHNDSLSNIHLLKWNSDFVLPDVGVCELHQSRRPNYRIRNKDVISHNAISKEIMALLHSTVNHYPINEVGCGSVTVEDSAITRIECTYDQNVTQCNSDEYNLLGYEYLCGQAGIRGVKGDSGVVGEIPTVRNGQIGDTGLKGLVGEDGEKGEIGEKGDMGIEGAQREKGISGGYGLTGMKGLLGEQGLKGEKGQMGRQGAYGDQGDDGEIRCRYFYEDKQICIMYGISILGLIANIIYVFKKWCALQKTPIDTEVNMYYRHSVIEKQMLAHDYIT